MSVLGLEAGKEKKLSHNKKEISSVSKATGASFTSLILLMSSCMGPLAFESQHNYVLGSMII